VIGETPTIDVGPPKRRIESRAIDSFLELREGDLVVHVSHGIAKFHGMQMLERGAKNARIDSSALRSPSSALEEHLLLEFRGGVFVYVPASKIDLVQKYVGSSQSDPELSEIRGTSWQGRKEKVEAAVMDMAAEMLELQAVRAAQPGQAYPVDTEWQKEFEASFPFRETPDQLTSLIESRRIWRKPADGSVVVRRCRLRKTELAVRAAFKAIDNENRSAVLCRPTILANRLPHVFATVANIHSSSNV